VAQPDWSIHPAVARGTPELAIAAVWPGVLGLLAAWGVFFAGGLALGLPPLAGPSPASVVLAGVLLARGYARTVAQPPYPFVRAFGLAAASLFLALFVTDRTQLLAFAPTTALRQWPEQLVLVGLEALLSVVYAAAWAGCVVSRARRHARLARGLDDPSSRA